ncbi:hypothetical protein KLEB273_gp091 [Bacillus phage vB_BauM_KLEB27-3]|nr:hypothetical protein KLEB273_gp091 [Bacillus phage vB_BauM_KLEB27-3]
MSEVLKCRVLNSTKRIVIATAPRASGKTSCLKDKIITKAKTSSEDLSFVYIGMSQTSNHHFISFLRDELRESGFQLNMFSRDKMVFKGRNGNLVYLNCITDRNLDSLRGYNVDYVLIDEVDINIYNLITKTSGQTKQIIFVGTGTVKDSSLSFLKESEEVDVINVYLNEVCVMEELKVRDIMWHIDSVKKEFDLNDSEENGFRIDASHISAVRGDFRMDLTQR